MKIVASLLAVPCVSAFLGQTSKAPTFTRLSLSSPDSYKDTLADTNADSESRVVRSDVCAFAKVVRSWTHTTV
jgi:hypothetical protein